MKYLITFIGLLLQRVDQLLVLLKIVRPKVIIYGWGYMLTNVYVSEWAILS